MKLKREKKQNQKTLFIVDDIADSFDYKNKYAIIEYLKDISKENNFYQIILTHNFDFLRTIENRFVGRNNCKMVVKTKNEIILEDASYLKPFNYFKSNLHTNNKVLVASIPFVRNLSQYCGYNDEFKKLTSLLHVKTDTNNITIGDIETIFKTVLKDKNSLQLSNTTKNVVELIFELADEILQDTNETSELENKIVLAIAIRLQAEFFMIKKINDQDFVNQITKNQTTELIKKYKDLFKDENVDLLDQVNLMTPENIHLNSFMYEPILDMGIWELRDLYKTVKEKLKIEN